MLPVVRLSVGGREQEGTVTPRLALMILHEFRRQAPRIETRIPTLEMIEREHIRTALTTYPTIRQAARALGICETSLMAKRRKYGFVPE